MGRPGCLPIKLYLQKQAVGLAPPLPSICSPQERTPLHPSEPLVDVTPPPQCFWPSRFMVPTMCRVLLDLMHSCLFVYLPLLLGHICFAVLYSPILSWHTVGPHTAHTAFVPPVPRPQVAVTSIHWVFFLQPSEVYVLLKNK
jgi:hypothetical protein